MANDRLENGESVLVRVKKSDTTLFIVFMPHALCLILLLQVAFLQKDSGEAGEIEAGKG